MLTEILDLLLREWRNCRRIGRLGLRQYLLDNIQRLLGRFDLRRFLWFAFTRIHLLAGHYQRLVKSLGVASQGFVQLARELLSLGGSLERIAHQMVVPVQSAIARHFRRTSLASRVIELLPGIGLKSREAIRNAAIFQTGIDLVDHLLDKPRC